MSKVVLDEIFKAYDIRGKVGSELTSELLKKIGISFANWLPNEEAVVVGYDMRPDSHDLANALIEGITSQGRDVVEIGQVTSDMVYFCVGDKSLAGGAMITASHNPGEYNGIKFCREEARGVGIETGLLEIKEGALSGIGSSGSQGRREKVDVLDDWVKHVLAFINEKELRKLHIAVDAGNGMAGKTFPALAKHLPFKVEEMYFELDGSFPNHIANPLEPKNLVDVQNMVITKGCDAGIGFDGDGDRAVLIDEKGVPLSGTIMTALLAEYFLKHGSNETILYNAICGKIVPETIEKYGGRGLRTKVGHSYIKADMRKYNAVFGGEHSGHYYFRDNYFADSGLIAALIVLMIMSNEDVPLSDLAAPFRRAYVHISETNFEVHDKKAIIERVKMEFANQEQDLLDGLTVYFDKGWFNVRPSNTEQLLRFNAEAKDQKTLDDITKRVSTLIESKTTK